MSDDQVGFLFTPRTKRGERLRLYINAEDRISVDARWPKNQSRVVTDLPSGGRYKVRRAMCDLGCFCDALVIEELGQ